MFGYDVLLSGAADVPIYRYLRLSWPAGGGANLGFADIRFYANGLSYPPLMFANNAPWPYVASASSVEGNQSYYQPYCAFDGDLAGDFTQAGSGPGWIELDCGAGYGISPDTVTLRPRSRLEVPAGPITLSGSNDGAIYETLCVITNPVWTSGVTNSYSTGRPGAAKALRSIVSTQSPTTQSYTVPTGVSLVILKLWGAGAGQAGTGNTRYGGPGGYLYCEVPVVPGDVLTFAAGGRGENANERGSAPQGGTSGSGQGNGGSSIGGGTGGGRTEVYKNGVLIAVAPGGGGGGGSDGFGGNGAPGGGVSGGDAPESNDSYGGKGGTQSAPGAAGYRKSGDNYGSPGNEGNGGNGAPGNANNRGGGGGGGGYKGGGGGGFAPGGQASGGGAGSAFAHPTLTKNATTAMGSGWTPPNTSDPDWIAAQAATGNTPGYGASNSTYPSYGLAVLLTA